MPTLRVIVDPIPEEPALAMAKDEALLRSAIHRQFEGLILRLYRFQRGSATIGIHQRNRAMLSSLNAKGQGWARRPTGGGLVFHGEDLIFTLIFPTAIMDELKNVNQSYYKIHRCIQAALKRAGVRTDIYEKACEKQQYDPRELHCFEQAVCGDLVKGNVKIVGGAQRRLQGYGMHQGSIAISSIPLSHNELEEFIIDEFHTEFQMVVARSVFDSDQEEATQSLYALKYGTSEWNWTGRMDRNIQTALSESACFCE